MNSNHLAASPVSGLLLFCRPVAIVWRISSVIVSALNGHSKWALSHVGQKVFKRVAPPLTHQNAAPAIVWVCLIVWTVTPFFHANPTFVRPVFKPDPGVIVFDVCPLESFVMQASARLSASISQAWSPDDLGCSALTKANAGTDELTGLATNHRPLTENFKPSNYGADREWFFSHSDSAFVMFSGGLSTPIGARCEFCSPSLNSSMTV